MAKKRSNNNPPEKVFRIGYVSASVFGHEIETDEGPITIRSVNVQKRYKDGDDVKYTSIVQLGRTAPGSPCFATRTRLRRTSRSGNRSGVIPQKIRYWTVIEVSITVPSFPCQLCQYQQLTMGTVQ